MALAFQFDLDLSQNLSRQRVFRDRLNPIDVYNDEPFGLGRFATDHSLTKAASRPLFARVRRYAPQGDN